MSWESFDWTTLLWIGGIVLFLFVMLRGCGGMMGGGGCCGMGGHGQDRPADLKEEPGEPPRDLGERKTPKS